MPDHCPRWKLRNPYEIIERLLGESAAEERRIVSRETLAQAKPRVHRDRHYTQAARLKIQSLMKGIRIWRN